VIFNGHTAVLCPPSGVSSSKRSEEPRPREAKRSVGMSTRLLAKQGPGPAGSRPVPLQRDPFPEVLSPSGLRHFLAFLCNSLHRPGFVAPGVCTSANKEKKSPLGPEPGQPSQASVFRETPKGTREVRQPRGSGKVGKVGNVTQGRIPTAGAQRGSGATPLCQPAPKKWPSGQLPEK